MNIGHEAAVEITGPTVEAMTAGFQQFIAENFEGVTQSGAMTSLVRSEKCGCSAIVRSDHQAPKPILCGCGNGYLVKFTYTTTKKKEA